MCAVAFLAMKWSNMTDFKWKSGNLVRLLCTENRYKGKGKGGEERRCAGGIFNYFRLCCTRSCEGVDVGGKD